VDPSLRTWIRIWGEPMKRHTKQGYVLCIFVLKFAVVNTAVSRPSTWITFQLLLNVAILQYFRLN
jgi:hypothetical protein